MTRLKARLDRRIARMSNSAKFDLELAIALVSALCSGCAAGLAAAAVPGYLIGLWWWQLASAGAGLCLAAAIVFWRLANYVGRDVLFAWDWDWW